MNPGVNNMPPQTGNTYKSDGTVRNLADYAGAITHSFFEGTTGHDHVVPRSTGIVVTNDAAETILVTVGSVASKVKANETMDLNFAPFTQVTVDPTTSLGTKQVETATLVTGNVTGAGDMAVIITAAGMEHSPKTILVPVMTADVTPALIMAKARAAVAADEDVLSMFTVGGSGAALVLTRAPRAVANDATLNISLGGAGTTATGITAAATSADTTAGVAPTAVGYRLWVRG